MSKYDWEAVERDYRAGLLSIRNLSSKHGVPESTVRSKAKTGGWQRDLSTDVKAATRAKLSRNTSRTSSAQMDDAQIIDEASSEATTLVLSHRHAISRWRGISEKLADTLSGIDVSENNHGDFARSLNSGIDALGKAIKLERQSYSLDSEADDGLRTFEELMAEVAPDDSWDD